MKINANKTVESEVEVLYADPEKMHGCYRGLPNDTYHAIKSHLSRSALMDYDRCPRTYWAKHINPNRPKIEPTAAMVMGSAFHKMILEPNTLQDEFIVKPEAVLLKDVGREQYEAYKRAIEEVENTSKTVIPFAMYKDLDAMRLTFLKNEQAVQLLEGARIEESFFWQDEYSGLLLKCRPDILHDNMIVDLKTCSDASLRAYQNEMVKYGYHVQGAMIRDGVEAIEGRRINNVINICVETKYPYNIAIYIIDEHAIDEGEVKYRNILIDLKHSIGHNEWADYGTQTIGLPKWAT